MKNLKKIKGDASSRVYYRIKNTDFILMDANPKTNEKLFKAKSHKLHFSKSHFDTSAAAEGLFVYSSDSQSGTNYQLT